MTKRSKRGPVLPPTQVLQPSFVVDPDAVNMQRELDRKRAAEKKHLDAQLTVRDLAVITVYRRDHPVAKNKTIAEAIQRNPKTQISKRRKGKPVLKDGKPQLLSVSALRRKIPPPQK
jgi:hypothetical protein